MNSQVAMDGSGNALPHGSKRWLELEHLWEHLYHVIEPSHPGPVAR
jgi:hypothetical protein